jgi:hypothetical protein
MELLALAVLVPAILVPIVLLWGFAGCGDQLSPNVSSDPPAAPTGLVATAVAFDQILLTWQDTSGGLATSFVVRRKEPGAAPFDLTPQSPITGWSFQDSGLEEGTFHTYQVRAVGSDGESDESNLADAFTLLKMPSGFTATPFGENQIDLAWTNESSKATGIRIERSIPPDTSFVSLPVQLSSSSNYSDRDLTKGTQYFYRLTALGSDGRKSESIGAGATTLEWKVSFPPPANPFTLDPNDAAGIDPTAQGFCIVQRFEPGSLAPESGKWIKITMRGPATDVTRLSGVYVSGVAAPGAPANPVPDPYDSAEDLQEVRFGGVSGVTLENGDAQTSGQTRYLLNSTQPLLVTFDVALNSGGILQAASGSPQGPQAFSRDTNGSPEASVKNKPPGYTGQPGVVFCVEKIEVSQ